MRSHVVLGCSLVLPLALLGQNSDNQRWQPVIPRSWGAQERGPLEHNGSVATLEDWFDPRRLKADYVPTGFIGYGFRTRAVPGHEFGLKLSEGDKRALIAFLLTL